MSRKKSSVGQMIFNFTGATTSTYSYEGLPPYGVESEISGEVVKVFAEKNNWSAFIMETEYGRVKAAGKIAMAYPGMKVTLTGQLVKTEYGDSFDFTAARIQQDFKRKGALVAFLKNRCNGCGEKRAERIWDTFGSDTYVLI